MQPLALITTLMLASPAPDAPAPRPSSTLDASSVARPASVSPTLVKPPPATGKKGWPKRVGPFGLVSKDGRNALYLGFAAQLVLQYKNSDGGSGVERDQELKPRLRRVRLLLKGNVLRKSLRYYLQLSAAPGSLELVDLWMEWAFTRYTVVRIGQQKINYTRHRMGSFKSQVAVDWSLLSPAFGDERQLGLVLHGVGVAPTWLDWTLGIFSGINQRANHAVGVAHTFREPVANPSNLADPGPVNELHPELAARVGYRFGRVDVSTDIDHKGGGLRFYAGAGMAWDLDADPTRDHALRLAAEAVAKMHGVSLAATLYLSWARTLHGRPLDLRWAMWGVLAHATVLLKKRVSLALRYALVERGHGINRAARTRSDALIAAAVDADEQAALTAQYALAGRIRRQHEATFGVNVYLIGRSLMWQTDVSYLPTQRDDGHRHDARVRSMLQLAF